MVSRRNPLGVIEDPIKAIIIDTIARLDRNYLVRGIEVKRRPGELIITVELRPRNTSTTFTISTWRIIELEERLVAALGVDADLTHSRIGVSPEGYLVIVYTIKSKEIADLLPEE
ncbi:hypothetical protein PYJP_15710 [Pyrofollis japonicus]|uniref:hypothetical protein n=1 Tax=Pyrofollis japonicus TaxID=3060460 RepID=UPI00295BB4CB|nr:hypothetical protein [Pyrofollis japonicus]BEP18219.1 hypothetical protein PYJP_15710 [Pyrofollis japonicus]